MTTHETPERMHVPAHQPASNLYARFVVALAEHFGWSLILLHATNTAEVVAASAAAAALPPLAPNIAATPLDPTSVVAAERRAVETELHALTQRLRSRGLAASYEQHEGAAADCDRRASARAGREPDRYDHAWPRWTRAPGLGQHCRRGATARALPDPARACTRGSRRISVTYLT